MNVFAILLLLLFALLFFAVVCCCLFVIFLILFLSFDVRVQRRAVCKLGANRQVVLAPRNGR